MDRPSFDKLRELYDASRFQDAHELVRPCLDSDISIHDLTPEELIFAGRLAQRLGGNKLRRWFFRRAEELDKDHPAVRCYARYRTRLRTNPLDLFRDFEKAPELETDDLDLQGSWLGLYAQVWGNVRCFDIAHGLLDKAEKVCPGDAWVWACRARVLTVEDRWDEALAAATRASELRPHAPYSLSAITSSLEKLKRFEEAAIHARRAALECQSFEVAGIAVWYLLAQGERSGEEERKRLAREAYELSARLDSLAILADRATKSAIAGTRADAAFALGDRERLREHSAKLHSRFFKEVSERLATPTSERAVVLPVKPVFQQHNTCLPASVASVLSVFGIDVDHGKLVEEITYGGSATWRAADWARERGLVVRHFTATPDIARRIIREGAPFVMMFQGDQTSHAIVVMGFDEASGTLVLHDPSCGRLTRVLADAFHERATPFGPEALLLVPRAMAAVADAIPRENHEVATGIADFWRALHERGRTAAGEVVDALEGSFATHPQVKRLRATWLSMSGKAQEALGTHQALLAEFPDNTVLHRDILDTVSRLGNSALSLKHLKAVAEGGLVPSNAERVQWVYPPASVLGRYADFLRASAHTIPLAERLLTKALTRYQDEASLYHILGDALWFGGRQDECVLPYRIASSLDSHDDHYARATADALRRQGKRSEALDLLKERVRSLGSLVDGSGSWLVWVDALESYGESVEATRGMEEAERERPDDSRVASFAVQFWARSGSWEKAEAALGRLRSSANRTAMLPAAAHYHDLRGDWREALVSTREWVSECPDDMEARELLLILTEKEGGRGKARELCSQWLAQRPDNDDIEGVVNGVLQRFFDVTGREELLRKRVARNPDDGWAWRELGHLLAGKAEALGGAPRDEAYTEIESVVAECVRTGPSEAVTLSLKGRLAQGRGDHKAAVSCYLDTLSADPEFLYCYDSCWESAASWAKREVLQLEKDLESRMSTCVGHLSPARGMALQIAGAFGVAEAESAIDRWDALSPSDPELVLARADTLLLHGRGKTDAERARALLVDALAIFPDNMVLSMSLAQALNLLESADDETAILEKLVTRAPTHAVARARLSKAYASAGRSEDALGLLDEGIDVDPADGFLRKQKADLLVELGRHDDAVSAFSDSVAALPEDVALRESFIGLLMAQGRYEKAIEIAREGVAIFDDGAFCWFLLAKVLRVSGRGSTSEVEAAFGRALELNKALFEAADELAIFLTMQHRYEEAEGVVRDQMPLLADVSFSRGRLAWILRESGRKSKAVKSMRRVLHDFPLYSWGWDRLLDWLEGDEVGENVRDLLRDVPEPLLQNPEFVGRRLLLMGKADPKALEHDKEWKQLLEDFPQTEVIHLQRFDQLWENNRRDECLPLMLSADKHHSTSSYFIARKVRALVHAGDADAALASARTLWHMPGDEEVWPEEAAWNAVRPLLGGDKLVGVLLDDVKAGVRLRHRVVELLVEQIQKQPTRLLIRRTSPARTLLGLLETLDASDAATGESKAAVLTGLVGAGAVKEVAKYWKRRKGSGTVETEVWAAAGSAMLSGGVADRKIGRELLSDWRDRDGVPMWAVINFNFCLRSPDSSRGWLFKRSRRDRLDDICQNSMDALKLLPHDNSALYHVCDACEAALRTGRDEEFLRIFNEYSHYLPRRKDDVRDCRDEYESMPATLRAFKNGMAATNSKRVLDLTRRLASAWKQSVPRWAKSIWLRIAKPHMSFPRRLWFRIIL